MRRVNAAAEKDAAGDRPRGRDLWTQLRGQCARGDARPGHTCAAGRPVATRRSSSERARRYSAAPRAMREWSFQTSPLNDARGPHRRSQSPLLRTSLPELCGAIYTSSGISPGLNGSLFVHSGRERSSRGIVRMRTGARRVGPTRCCPHVRSSRLPQRRPVAFTAPGDAGPVDGAVGPFAAPTRPFCPVIQGRAQAVEARSGELRARRSLFLWAVRVNLVRGSNAARFARGELEDCLSDAGPFCARALAYHSYADPADSP
jgi:hypothetical protein